MRNLYKNIRHILIARSIKAGYFFTAVMKSVMNLGIFVYSGEINLLDAGRDINMHALSFLEIIGYKTNKLCDTRSKIVNSRNKRDLKILPGINQKISSF